MITRLILSEVITYDYDTDTEERSPIVLGIANGKAALPKLIKEFEDSPYGQVRIDREHQSAHDLRTTISQVLKEMPEVKVYVRMKFGKVFLTKYGR